MLLPAPTQPQRRRCQNNLIYWNRFRNGCSIDTDYVKFPISPDFVDNFPDFFPILCNFNKLKSQFSHGLYPPLLFMYSPLQFSIIAVIA